MSSCFRLGVDENGLGARLGPLVVTSVLAEVDERGARALSRKLPKSMRQDLDDSKRVVAHGDVALGEAWARTLLGLDAQSPAALLERLLADGAAELRAPCPRHVEAQCWSTSGEAFGAEPEVLKRVIAHRGALERRGIRFVSVRSSVVCTNRLNALRARGINRFVADLHAMESLVLAQRALAGADLQAVCGKVGGIGAYSRFFGPLAGRLHVTLQEKPAKSAYHFPGIGEVCFVRDADGRDVLVMLASLVGKYVRELFMARIARFHPSPSPANAPSGYHDPVSAAFVERTALSRRARRIPDACFERARDEIGSDPKPASAPARRRRSTDTKRRASATLELFSDGRAAARRA
ncbi:MAG TPA: hypothetical protein VKY73_19565 [Polyangiaceae bacterium]|nr:hypothetical protein [Polyangiaceae bacterium]